MQSGLTPATDHTIATLAHSFDGYAYAKKVWHAPEEKVISVLQERMRQVEQSGRLFLKAEDNFATNFGLHRMFHHWGWLPSAKSPEWYTMLFFYLHLYRLPIPAAHRHESSSLWASRPKGSAEAAAAEIRLVLRR